MDGVVSHLVVDLLTNHLTSLPVQASFLSFLAAYGGAKSALPKSGLSRQYYCHGFRVQPAIPWFDKNFSPCLSSSQDLATSTGWAHYA